MQKEKFSRYHTTMYIYDCTGSRVWLFIQVKIIMEINLSTIIKSTQTKLCEET